MRWRRVLSLVVAGQLGAGIGGAVVHERGGEVYVEDDSTFVEPAKANCVRATPAAKGQAALRLIAYPWASLDYEVVFEGGHRGYLAITDTGRKRIRVFVRTCQSVASVGNILAHEFGHAVDDRHMTPERRGEYLAARGISGEWYGCNRCSDYATPAGDFAEVFGFIKGPAGPFRSKLAGRPTPAQAERLERFFFPPPPAPVVVVISTTTTTKWVGPFGPITIPRLIP